MNVQATMVLTILALSSYGQSQKTSHALISYCLDGFYEKNSPLQYLQLLREDFAKTNAGMVTVCPPPRDWVRKEHIDSLMSLIYDVDSVTCIVSIWSSTLPKDKFSSIGREAQGLIEFFRDSDSRKSYPRATTSFGPPDIIKAHELETWWLSQQKNK